MSNNLTYAQSGVNIRSANHLLNLYLKSHQKRTKIKTNNIGNFVQ